MRRADLRLAKVAAEQRGLVRRTDAARAGVTDRDVDRLLEVGLLVAVHPGVYRHAAVPFDGTSRLLAAVWAAGRAAVASHRSAAWLWQLRDVPRWRREVTVPGQTRKTVSRVTVHRTDRLEPMDVSAVDGVPVTTVARTLLDLGGVTDPPVVRQAAQDAVIRDLVQPEDLVCVLERLGRRGRRGTAALRKVVEEASLDARLESRLEQELLELILRCQVPPPVPQHELRCVDGRRARLDFAWPAARVAVEADGRRWHATTADFERDLARGNSITASGWSLYRFGWADVRERRAGTVAAIHRAFRAAGAAA
jgi:predicted transcriptional regulator of viral defense system